METYFGEWFSLPRWVQHNYAWWVLSDTHGRAAELQHLLRLTPPDARIIHLGDIGDRGPHSLECFRILDQTEAVLIAGNHDLFISPGLGYPGHVNTKIIRNLWTMNGGTDFMYEINGMPDYICGQIPNLIARVLARQNKYVWDGNVLFLHGGADPAENLMSFLEQPAPSVWAYQHETPYPSHPTWARSEFLRLDENHVWEGAKCRPFFIHGHTRLTDESIYPRRTNWRLGVDWREGMSALEIREGRARFVDVPGKSF